MAPASSPYAVFRASDWSPVVAEPIGLGQCLRIQPKKYYPQRDIQKKSNGNTLGKVPPKSYVQLAFA
ncbi:hypothetical protein [Prochlorococcus sp. MIT 1307]|uniref:hypothetical protein n=1 Tax=Prochlorococcus sp. MIT 1307 TaxID=3096219 RepID=UPI002A74D260|nr:hypothetical protein [Prochlorococcus sp. MIT 1307]